MGLVEALILAVAFWLLFAFIAASYYVALAGDTRTGVAGVVNRFMISHLSDSPPTERDIAALRSATRPWRTALAAFAGGALVVLTQGGALNYALDNSPAVDSGARAVMAAEFLAAVLWAGYLMFEWRRIRGRSG